jgi:hypothetical protein
MIYYAEATVFSVSISLQVLEAQENVERLQHTLDSYGNVQQTINQLSDRCEDLHMLAEKQVHLCVYIIIYVLYIPSFCVELSTSV